MNWRRGLLRLWLVVSVAWAIGSMFWLAHVGAEIAQQQMDNTCNLGMTSEEFGKCVEQAQGPAEGGTWTLAGLRNGWWLLMVAPPILLLVFGAMLFKVFAWVTLGFSAPK